MSPSGSPPRNPTTPPLPSLWCIVALLVACSAGDGPDDDAGATPDAEDAAPEVDETDRADVDDDLAVRLPSDFRLGVATSAHQVEGNTENTWTLWETLPAFAHHVVEPSGQAADHFQRYEEDLDLVADLGLDVFRLSIEWSRIEPARGAFDPEATDHYRDVLSATRARGITPSVTLHHFTEPQWFVDLTGVDPTDPDSFCAGGPHDDDLCFWGNANAVDAFGAFCAHVGREYGDLVDEWMTINELTGYWLEATIVGDFPPGLTATTREEVERRALPVLEGLIDAHVACYAALHESDTVDADGDGLAARVGLTMGTGPVRPADPEDEGHVAAAAQANYLASFLVFDAVIDGRFDADFDGDPERDAPHWADTIDLIGLQYYASTTMIDFSIHPLLLGTPCMNTGDQAQLELQLQLGCPPPPTDDFPLQDDPPHLVYGRQHDPEGLVEILGMLHDRYPDRPIVITENGFANHDEKRAGSIVRHLVACRTAIDEGIPLEGYYHWSLIDNFEWGRGYAVRLGLFSVDFDSDLARTSTIASDVYGEIARGGGITNDMLETWGGSGPLVTSD